MKRTGVSRRQFVLSAAAAAGLSWFDAPRLLADTREQSLTKYGGFAMGIQSYSLRGFDVEQALDTIRDLELHWVEFFRAHMPMSTDPELLAKMEKLLADRDISISGHGVSAFSADHEANRKVFEFADAAGIRNISADPHPDSFASLDKLCVEFPGVRLAIHNHGPGHRYDKAENALQAVRAHHPNIGFCADLGHYIRSAEDPEKVIRVLQDRLYGIHLKDFAEMKKDAPGVILGSGVMNLQEVFMALKKAGFPADGALSLEYEEHFKNPVDDIRQCLIAASEAARKVAEA